MHREPRGGAQPIPGIFRVAGCCIIHAPTASIYLSIELDFTLDLSHTYTQCKSKQLYSNIEALFSTHSTVHALILR